MCEVEQEHINARGLHCNVDGANNGESHCDKTHVDDYYKERCELVNPTATNEFGEVEIVNEHIHARITHHRMSENYVDVTLMKII